jgi:hypothetical protein
MHAGTEETRTTAVNMSQRQSRNLWGLTKMRYVVVMLQSRASKRTPSQAESAFERLQVLRRVEPPLGGPPAIWGPSSFNQSSFHIVLMLASAQYGRLPSGNRPFANLSRSRCYGYFVTVQYVNFV